MEHSETLNGCREWLHVLMIHVRNAPKCMGLLPIVFGAFIASVYIHTSWSQPLIMTTNPVDGRSQIVGRYSRDVGRPSGWTPWMTTLERVWSGGGGVSGHDCTCGIMSRNGRHMDASIHGHSHTVAHVCTDTTNPNYDLQRGRKWVSNLEVPRP